MYRLPVIEANGCTGRLIDADCWRLLNYILECISSFEIRFTCVHSSCENYDYHASFCALGLFSLLVSFYLMILYPPPPVSRTTLCVRPTRRKACWPAATWCCRPPREPSTRRPRSGGSPPSPCAGSWSQPGPASGPTRTATWWTALPRPVREGAHET